MVKSLEELKSELNIKTISVDWNECFPYYMLESTYKNDSFYENICLFVNALSEQPRYYINRKGLYQLGVLAEVFDLLLAYFVIDYKSIELFFYPKKATNEWLETFKKHLNRRQFFNTVKSYRTIKKYNSYFDISSYYQLCSPDIPSYNGKPNVIKLNNDYLLIQYPNDVYSSDYKVIKIGTKFETLNPKISFNSDVFECITLKVEDKVFTGDSIKHLWDGTERTKNVINIKFKNIDYTLTPETGLLRSYDSETNTEREDEIEKFKVDAYTFIISVREYKGKTAAILSNGFIWYLDDNRFLNLKSIPGFEHLDVEIFGMSSEKRGIILRMDENSLENVPCSVFEKLLFKY